MRETVEHAPRGIQPAFPKRTGHEEYVWHGILDAVG